jgi:hypothetical protein
MTNRIPFPIITGTGNAIVGITTASRIMRSDEFKRGFEEARAGRPPQFDCDEWDYERGRLFAYIAPRAMPLRVDGKLNPKALALFIAAEDRNLIL